MALLTLPGEKHHLLCLDFFIELDKGLLLLCEVGLQRSRHLFCSQSLPLEAR